MFFMPQSRQKKCGRSVNRRLLYFCAYTLCFFVIAIMIFSVFIQEKKSFIWTPDGLQQHFNALLYYRSWLLDIFRTLITEQRLEIPLWDIHIGLGSDVLTTLHYYVIGDPLNLLSVFVPDETYMELFYNGMILLRIYLAGLAFSAYCHLHGQKPYSTLLGALVYDFCFWVIVAIRHPYFLNPMIYLPLILIGVDRIYKKEKPWQYIGMLALATISSFYFTYMICIFVLFYVILRYFMTHHKLCAREMGSWAGRFVVYSLTSIAIAAVILVPVAAMTLSTGRADTQNYLPLLYPLSYYKKLIAGFLIGGSGYWSELGYTGLEIIAVLVLFMNRKHFRGLRLGFVCMTLLLLFPYAGHLLNGGSYVINRYMWAYSMLISFIAVKMYPSIIDLKMKKRVALFWAGIAYIAICLEVWTTTKKQYLLIALVMFAVILWMIIGTNRKTKQSFAFKALLLFMVMFELVYQGWAKYSPEAGGYVEEFADSGTAVSMLKDYAAGSLVRDVAPVSNWRFESAQAGEWKNTAMQLKLNGVSYYFSLANPYINQFQREMYINQSRDFCYNGFDGRTILDTLSSVRYYTVQEEEMQKLPYNYNTLVNKKVLAEGTKKEDTFVAYENELALPIGFTSTSYIDRATYETMTVTEKQQALLQGIVVEKDTLISQPLWKTESFHEISPVYSDVKIPYEIVDMSGLEISEHTIQVAQEDASMTIAFDGLPDSETYLILRGVDYESGNAKKPKSRVQIKISCDEVSKKVTYLSPKNNFYSGVTDFLVNVGYRTDAADNITVEFEEKGNYAFEAVEVVCQPMEYVTQQSLALAEEELDHLTFATNEMTGNIFVNQEKLLCVTLPYSEGWRAYVDGEETKVLCADTMYMAILVPEGKHQIRFCYRTPYLMAGAILTLLGLLSLAVLVYLDRRKHPRLRRVLAEKKEFAGIDFAKIIAAFLVAAIHIPPLADISAGASELFSQVICRIAVPFFFLCSGFFLGEKIKEWGKVKQYLIYIGKMYVFWTLCYFPQMLDRFWEQENSIWKNVTELLRRFFLVGSYIQLWYLLATIVAVLLLYLCVSRLKIKEGVLLAVILVLYLIGTAGNAYRHVWDEMPQVASAIKQYQNVFFMTRNGLFFGFPFIAAGYLIAVHRDGIKKICYWSLTAIFGVAMILEAYDIKNRWGSASHDMYLMTPFVSVFLFLAVAFVKVPQRAGSMAKILRQLSTRVFLLHLLLNFYLKKIPGMKEVMGNHLWQYLIVAGGSLLVAFVIYVIQHRAEYRSMKTSGT